MAVQHKHYGLNNGNHIDTFAEYIITLVLWWAATWFPRWLLRIFRDDCCDGSTLSRTLDGYFDKPAKPSPSTPPPPNRPPKFDLPPSEPMQTRPETRSLFKRSESSYHSAPGELQHGSTSKYSRYCYTELRATTLRDVAKLERQTRLLTTAKQNLAMLTTTRLHRVCVTHPQQLNLRTELFTRASTKNHTFAEYVLSTTARSSQQYINKRK